MVKVKICGLKRNEDIGYVNALLPDYAGFVFAKSKRQVDVNTAKMLIAHLNQGIKKAGIFVNEDIETVKRAAEALRLDVLQFHGDESAEYIKAFKGYTVWKAVSIREGADLSNLYETADAFVLDNPGGGTGKRFNWDLLKDKKIDKPIVLAGGLNPLNVKAGIEKIRPFCADVSSGVETGGVKDYIKIKAFIEKVRH